MFCAKKMPHKFCNNIFLHPAKKEISYHLFYNIIIVQVQYITIVTKDVVSIGYNRFLFLHSYSGEGLGTTHLCLHPSTYEEKEIRYIQYGQLLLFLYVDTNNKRQIIYGINFTV